MAIINKNNSYMEFPLQIKRQYAGPIEFTEIWYDLEQAKEYAKSGATAYAGQTIKVVDEVTKTITTYTIQIDGTLKSESTESTSALEAKINKKIEELENGRVWKPSVETKADIATTYPNPEDTWCVITKDTNIIWMYEASKQQWIDLGHSVVHENATQQADGLMSKEDKKKLDGLETTLSALETKITNAHNKDKAALEKKIQDVDAKFVAATPEQIEGLFTA